MYKEANKFNTYVILPLCLIMIIYWCVGCGAKIQGDLQETPKKETIVDNNNNDKDDDNNDDDRDEETEPEVIEVPVEVPVEVIVEVPVNVQPWEDIFLMVNAQTQLIAGEVMITQDAEDNLQFRSLQELITINPSDSYGLLPKFNLTGLVEYSPGYVTDSRDVNYNSNHDLEYNTNNNIAGKKYTIYEFSLDENNKLTLKVTIFDGDSKKNGSINNILRTIEYVSK